MNWPAGILILILCAAESTVLAEEPSVRFAGPDVQDVRVQFLQWATRATSDEQIRQQLIARWADDTWLTQLSDEDLLDVLVESFAAVDPSTQRLLESSWSRGPLEEVVYDGVRDLDVYRSQLELFRARWLTQHQYFDEALEILEQLSPEKVVDPAGLFFYRAVCQSELLKRDAALDSLNLLLNHTLEVPLRFRTVAVILEKELSQRQEDDLGHISRLMADAGRHLELGRSGDRVQERQNQVIEAIDRLLKDAEQKQQEQGSGGQQGQGNPQGPPGGKPADQSRIHGSAAEGEADRREVKETGSWGLLDRREEARVRELIRRQFPANYLDIISEYSRRIAEQE